MICKFCGKEIGEGLTFCSECGKRIDGKMMCPDCGGLIDENSKFCGFCGKRADGKKSCPSRGADVGNNLFCPDCGVKLEETAAASAAVSAKTLDVRKYLTYASYLFAGLAAIIAFIFTFFIGCKFELYDYVEKINIFDYFGKEYKNLDVSFLSKENKLIVYIPKVFGTILGALSILSVVVFVGLSAYAAYKKDFGRFNKFAIRAFMAYAGFTTALYAMHAATISQLVSYNRSFSVKVEMNGATLAGLILGGIFTGSYFICRLALVGGRVIKERGDASVASAMVIAILAIVLAGFLSGPVASMCINYTETKAGFMVLLSTAIEYEATSKLIAYSVVGFIAGLAMIALSVYYVLNKIEYSSDIAVKDRGKLIAAGLLALSILQFVMAFYALDELMVVLGGGIYIEVTKGYTMVLIELIICIIIFAAEVTAFFISRKTAETKQN